jgi:hypothetical protein
MFDECHRCGIEAELKGVDYDEFTGVFSEMLCAKCLKETAAQPALPADAYTRDEYKWLEKIHPAILAIISD